MALELRLLWQEVAPGLDFHAGLVSVTRRGGGYGMHTHDFGEIMYVLTGQGVHLVNGTTQTVVQGDLLLIRPQERHTIRVRPGERTLFINVAFPVKAWTEFVRVAAVETTAAAWDRAPLPPTVHVPPTQQEGTASIFHRALRVFQENPTRWELCRFWTAALPLLLTDARDVATEVSGPEWLGVACHAMRDGRNLSEGLPRLLALSGVSAAHLSRTLKHHLGQTPTEFLNDLRLAHAAVLLATTPGEIIEIAGACGFDNLSYFYRLFRRKYGRTPRAYRLRAHESVMP